MKHLKKVSWTLVLVAVLTAIFALSSVSADVLEVTDDDGKNSYGTIYEETTPETTPSESVGGNVDVGYETYQFANIYSDGVTISVDDADTEGTVYSLEVTTSGEAYSSFRLTLWMPEFVTVTEVAQSDDLVNVSENGVFVSDVSDNTVTVSFSSPTNFSDMTLFSVNFTVNDYSEQSSWVECYDYQFVNEDAQTVDASVELGRISITRNIIMGDVNDDQTVNLEDLLIIQRSIVNDRYPLSDVQFRAADIDKNGVVDMVDCQYIQNFLVGRMDSLEDVKGSDEDMNGDSGESGGDEELDKDLAYLIEQAMKNAQVEWDQLPEKGVSMSAVAQYEAVYFHYVSEMQYADSVATLEAIRWECDQIIIRIMRTAEEGTEPETCAHENTYFESGDATCTEGAYSREICEDCGETVSGSSGPANGHSFDENGQCVNCGEKQTTEKKEILYTYNSDDVTLILYSDETVFFTEQSVDLDMDGKLDLSEGEGYWYMVDGKIYVYTYDNEYVFTATESGELVPYEEGGDDVPPTVCPHDNIYTDGMGATCTEDGYLREICRDCGETLTASYPTALGHSFDENGQCVNCGETQTAEEKEILYTYVSDELTLDLYSDYTSEYTERVRTEDGSVMTMKGTNKWNMADGKIYAYTDSNVYVFTETAEGGLVLS